LTSIEIIYVGDEIGLLFYTIADNGTYPYTIDKQIESGILKVYSTIQAQTETYIYEYYDSIAVEELAKYSTFKSFLKEMDV